LCVDDFWLWIMIYDDFVLDDPWMWNMIYDD
jgi:hypothetical protein